MTCREDGGIEPIYLCENHAKEVGPSVEHSPRVRTTTPQSADSDNPPKSDERTQTPKVAGAKSKASASSEPSASLVDTKLDTKADTKADSKVARGTADPSVPSVRSPARDLTYGNSAKALVDEAIWNMAAGDLGAYRKALEQGKPAAEAAQAAGGQLAVVHRKISDYMPKMEAVLSESKAIVNVAEAIDKPLEQATLEIIGNDAMSDLAKDAAVQQLGTLQEWVKHDLQGEITPVEADRIMRAIGDRLNWGASAAVSEELKPAYRALYGSLKGAIRAAVPEAQDLHERLTNLYAAKSDLENPPAVKETMKETTKELNPLTA
jgi:hypothetical protein